MSLDRDGKTLIVVAALVMSLLLGINYMVSNEPDNSWIVWIIGLLVLALLVWLWMRRDDVEARKSAAGAAEKAARAAEAAHSIAEKAAAAARPEESTRAEARVEPAPERSTPAAPPPPPAAPAEPLAGPEAESRPPAKAPAEPAKPPAAPEKEPAPQPAAAAAETPDAPDDLTRIEGVGPKYRDALIAAGLDTFEKIAAADEERFVEIIREAGMRRPGSVGSWAEQAALAARRDWEGLEALQKKLSGGRR